MDTRILPPDRDRSAFGGSRKSRCQRSSVARSNSGRERSTRRADEVRRLFFEEGELRTARLRETTHRSFSERRGGGERRRPLWALGETPVSMARAGKSSFRGGLPKSVLDAEMNASSRRSSSPPSSGSRGSIRSRPRRKFSTRTSRSRSRRPRSSSRESGASRRPPSSARGWATATGFSAWLAIRCRAISTSR